jgi:hypothetical protein
MPHRGKHSPSLSTDEGRDARVREVVADVTSRLAGVCSALPPDEFAKLVRRIAEVTVKYEALVELRAARVDPQTPPPAV